MVFLLFSGPQDSGKTSSIKLYAEYLHVNQGYSIIPLNYLIPISTRADVQCILEKNGKRILVHSETDQIGSIDKLCDYLENNNPIDVVITAARDDGDYMRNYLFNSLSINNPTQYLEIPLGRMVRGGRRALVLPWYLKSVLEIAKRIGLLNPFNLYVTI